MCDKFDPSVWGDTGPQAITRTLQRICNVTQVSNMKPENCWGFNVMPTSVFYPVHYSLWKEYFDIKYANRVLRETKDSIAIHVWNKLSSEQPIFKDFNNQTLVKN